MSKTRPLIVLLLTVWALHIVAQVSANSMQTGVLDLQKRISQGEHKAILEMGDIGDKSLVAYLRRLSLESRWKGDERVKSNIQMALAKLGEQKEFDEIVNQLKNKDPHVQYAAVRKLVYIGGNKSIRILVALLDETKWRAVGDPDARGPNGELPQDRVGYSPLNEDAMRALSELVPNPPVNYKEGRPKQSDVPKWKDWWGTNKSKYASES